MFCIEGRLDHIHQMLTAFIRNNDKKSVSKRCVIKRLYDVVLQFYRLIFFAKGSVPDKMISMCRYASQATQKSTMRVNYMNILVMQILKTSL